MTGVNLKATATTSKEYEKLDEAVLEDMVKPYLQSILKGKSGR